MSVRNTLLVETFDKALYKTYTSFGNPNYPIETIENILTKMERYADFSEEEIYKIMEYEREPVRQFIDKVSGRDLTIIEVIFNLFLSCIEESNLFDIAFSIHEGIDNVREGYIIAEDNEDQIIWSNGSVTFPVEGKTKTIHYNRYVSI